MKIDFEELTKSDSNEITRVLLSMFRRAGDAEIRRCINLKQVEVKQSMITLGGSDPDSVDGGSLWLEITRNQIKFIERNGAAGRQYIEYRFDSLGNAIPNR